MQKYTFKPDQYSSHSQILCYLKKHGQGCRILDVGTAQGMLGKGLSDLECHLTGVEIDTKLSELARPFYNDMINGDISNLMIDGNFDFIVFADVLEHLVNPQSVLVHARELLTSNGKIIVSLPNIANIYIRLKLLLGKFDYTEKGICDVTHLRFYVKSTAVDLLDSAGYEVIKCFVTPIPFYLVFSKLNNNIAGKFISSLSWLLTKMWPTLLAYQFIFIAVPKADNKKENKSQNGI